MRSLGPAAALLLGACAAAPGATPMIATRLYFGFAKASGASVTPAEFDAFVRDVITPRFPDGLTSISAYGQWRDPVSGGVVREESRVVLLLHSGDADAERRLAEIVAAYKLRHDQRSVLREDAAVRVAS